MYHWVYVGSVHTSGARVLLIPPIRDTKLKNDKLKMTTWTYIMAATQNYVAVLIAHLLPRDHSGCCGNCIVVRTFLLCVSVYLEAIKDLSLSCRVRYSG
jgi:hypothetical protein